MKPGMKGTCWCCGDDLPLFPVELCLECEKERAQIAPIEEGAAA